MSATVDFMARSNHAFAVTDVQFWTAPLHHNINVAATGIEKSKALIPEMDMEYVGRVIRFLCVLQYKKSKEVSRVYPKI